MLSLLEKSSWFHDNFDTNSLMELGSGGFGSVFTALSLKGNKKLAIKVLKPDPLNDIKDMLNEVSLIVSLKKCKNVIQIKDTFTDTSKGQVMFSMELGDGSLDQFIKNFHNKRLKPTLLPQILADCLDALIFAADRSISHLDIKPANIIYFKTDDRTRKKGLQTDTIDDKSLIFKISDWGGGIMRANKTKMHSSNFGFTMGYAANEILNNSAFNGNKADVFSLGMSLLACCGIPYSEFKHLSSFPKATSYYRELEELLDTLDNGYNEIKVLLKEMIKYDFEERIGLEELRERILSLNDNENFVCSSKLPVKDIRKKEENKIPNVIVQNKYSCNIKIILIRKKSVRGIHLASISLISFMKNFNYFISFC